MCIWDGRQSFRAEFKDPGLGGAAAEVLLRFLTGCIRTEPGH